MKIIANKNDFINIAIDESNVIEIDVYSHGEVISRVVIETNNDGKVIVNNFPKKENDK